MRLAFRHLIAAAVVPSSTIAFAADHPHGIAFVHAAIEGDNSETTLGALAAKKGQSDGTRSFGHMLAMDHSKGRVEAVAVARSVRTYAPKSMAPEAIVERAKLNRLNGHEFDREFAKYMVQDHKDYIANFQSEAQSADQPVIVSFAKKTLPVLEKHLDAAQKLAASLRQASPRYRGENPAASPVSSLPARR